MTNDPRLLQVLNFLRAKQLVISTDNEWLLGCYDYYLSENQSSNIDLAALKNFVYEQWLLADLRDVAEACLPQNIASIDKLMLNNSYPLQVDMMINVSESCYSQFQKIKKLTSANLEVSDKIETQSWEPKMKRMLKLTCTDGVHTVFGMEYEPIRALQEPFIPGCKILVTGPVECRKGVMLLKAHNISVLGGEVDSLLTDNAPINILTRKLKEFTEGDLPELTNPVTERVINAHMNHPTNSMTDETSTLPSFNQSVVSNTENTITFINDDMNDDDEIFLSNKLCEVENLLQASDTENHLGTTHSENQSAIPCSNSSDSLPMESRFPASVSTVSTLESAYSAVPPINRGLRTDEQIVPSNQSSLIDRYIRTDNVENDGVNSRDVLSLCSNTSIRTINRLRNCKAMRPELTYKCKARVIKLRSKPRVKNEKWLMSVDIGDADDSLEVSFHSSFLDIIFGYSALEVSSQKDRIKSNPLLKGKIDQIIKEGALKILSLRGEFHIKNISNEDLPTVMRVREEID